MYGSQALVSPDNSQPFSVERWEDVTGTSAFGASSFQGNPVRQQGLTIWVYDAPGDYTRIDKIVRRIREILTDVVAERADDGWITQIDWAGDSGDLYDDIYSAIARTSSFSVISSGR